MTFEDFCRGRTRRRMSAIRTAIDFRQGLVDRVKLSLTDTDKLAGEARLRMVRAESCGSSEETRRLRL